jgi:ABC-type branched-subunit amino acid transport system substrate-binding protein
VRNELEKPVEDKFDIPMYYGIIFGYGALKVMAKAIESAQSLDPVRIRDALKQTDYKALEGRIRFDNFEGYKNQCRYFPSVIRWEKGKRVHLDIMLIWQGLIFRT